MSSSSGDIDLEEIRTYDSEPITHDFISTTIDAPHVGHLWLKLMIL
jgi:hypothetical protein